MSTHSDIHTNWTAPLQEFWKNHIQAKSIEHQSNNHEVKIVKAHKYSAISKNKELMDRILRIVRSKQLKYQINAINWNWNWVQGWMHLIAGVFVADNHKLPTFMLQTTQHQHIVLNTPDAGAVCMHIYYPSNLIKRNNPMNPALLFFPSLSSNQENFTPLIQFCTMKMNWVMVVFNRRGLCEELKTPQFYVMGNDKDTLFMLQHLKSMSYFTNRPMFAAGVSMGGNQLLRFISRYENDISIPKIRAVTTISSPIHPRDVHPLKPEDAQLLSSQLSAMLTKKYVQQFLYYFEQPALEEITKTQLLSAAKVEQVEAEYKRQKQIYLQLQNCHNMYEWLYLHLQLTMSETDWNQKQKKIFTKLNANESISKLVQSNDERIWDQFREYAFDSEISNTKTPILFISAQDDPLVQLSAKSRDAVTAAQHSIVLMSVGGLHGHYRDNLLNVTDASWAESIMFDYFQTFL